MIELPTGYYLTNFNEILQFVTARYWQLLNEQERGFFSTFRDVSKESQYLYVRMLMRKGQIFRQSKLRYPEITNVKVAAQELADACLIAINPNLSAESIISLYSKAEWHQIIYTYDKDTAKQLKSLKRAEFDFHLICWLSKQDNQVLLNEPLYELLNSHLFNSFNLLYFGNPHQDLTEFILRDLGVYTYANYKIDQNNLPFTRREQIDKHLALYDVQESLTDIHNLSVSELIDIAARIPTNGDRTLDRRAQRIRNGVARQLERLEALDEALGLYSENKQAPANERRARILVKQNKPKIALNLCEEIIKHSNSEEELAFAHSFAYRTAKKIGVTRPRPIPYRPPEISLALPFTEESVEQASADYLSQFGDCFYVENSLFNTIFGLYFWDVIFASVREAFTHPFQIRPHDLYDNDFLFRREQTFKPLWQTLQDKPISAEDIFEKWKKIFWCRQPFCRVEIHRRDNSKQVLKSRRPYSFCQNI